MSPPQTFPVSSSPCSPVEAWCPQEALAQVWASLSSRSTLVAETRLQAISLRGAGIRERGKDEAENSRFHVWSQSRLRGWAGGL